MGTIRKLKCVSKVVLLIVLAFAVVYNIIVFAAFKDLSFYSGDFVENISTLSTRTSFVTENGDVYITGDYYKELNTSVGLRGVKKVAYNKARTPVKIFGDLADKVILTSFGGFILQKANLYIFSIEETEYKIPCLITNDCLVPVNAFEFSEKGYCCLYVNTKNELILKSINQNWSQKYLENVLECKYYSNGVYVLLKTDGSLWLIDGFKTSGFTDQDNCIKVADNIKSFAYSQLAFGGQGNQDNFVLLSKDNKVYKKYGLKTQLEEIYIDAKDIGIHRQNIIVLTSENKLLYFTSDGTMKTMKAENIKTFSASDDVICAYSETEGLLFWGMNKYNVFGCDTASLMVDLDSEPVNQGPIEGRLN